MRLLPVLLAAAAVILSCSRSAGTSAVDQEGLERIRTELGERSCAARLDSLAFAIDGILFRAGISGDEGPLERLLPDSLPACPVSGSSYVIRESQAGVTVECPSGHGFRTLAR